VHLHKLVDVELRLLQCLHFADVTVVKRVNSLARFLDIAAHGVGKQFVDDVLQIFGGNLSRNDLDHLLSDGTDLRGLRVRCLLVHVGTAACESNGEDAKQVSVGGFDVTVSFDARLPFLHEGSQLVGGHRHPVKVGHHVLPLHIFADQLELAERDLVLVEIGLSHFEDAALETVAGNFCSDRSGDDGFADGSDVEVGRGFHVVPVFAGEGVNDLLLRSLLSLGQTLVLTDGHLGGSGFSERGS